MKKNIIAEITSLPDTLRSTARIAKCALATAGAIALIGVTAALSNDSGRNKSAFFIDNGIVFVGDIARGVDFAQVEKKYAVPQPAFNDQNHEKEGPIGEYDTKEYNSETNGE